MREQQWLPGTNPVAMLTALRRFPTTARKRRLFAVACCYRFWPRIVSEWSKTAVTVVLNYADGKATGEELAQAITCANLGWLEHYQSLTPRERERSPLLGPVYAIGYNTAEADLDQLARLARLCGHVAQDAAAAAGPDAARAEVAENAAVAGLVREVFGNPFRPAAFDPTWRTSTAVGLATRMYDSLDFGPMPILADALQEAGCDNEDVLNHCRGTVPHVRGCWVVDLILGRS